VGKKIGLVMAALFLSPALLHASTRNLTSMNSREIERGSTYLLRYLTSGGLVSETTVAGTQTL
jgi:hypothetical protein